NVQVAAGVLGAPPTNTGSTAFQLLVNTQGRLTTEEEFGNIIVRAAKDGQITRIRDLGRVELGSSTYALRSLLDNKPAAALPISQRPGSVVGPISRVVRAGFSPDARLRFGLVLAIGIGLDGAIGVGENVERNIALGHEPQDATRRAMQEVSGPIVAIALVLCAVFVPTAFIVGLSGEFYKPFALTIAISTVISAFNSLTGSPALAALLLKAHGAKKDAFTRAIEFAFGWFFKLFNRFFGTASRGYGIFVTRTLRSSLIAVVVYAGLIGLTILGFSSVPTGFVPTQDKG